MYYGLHSDRNDSTPPPTRLLPAIPEFDWRRRGELHSSVGVNGIHPCVGKPSSRLAAHLRDGDSPPRWVSRPRRVVRGMHTLARCSGNRMSTLHPTDECHSPLRHHAPVSRSRQTASCVTVVRQALGEADRRMLPAPSLPPRATLSRATIRIAGSSETGLTWNIGLEHGVQVGVTWAWDATPQNRQDSLVKAIQP
jgi:hypothetical protein